MTDVKRKIRLCTRCSEPSVEQQGSNTTGKLCIQHNKERRDRQVASRNQPDCRCGSKLPLGAKLCRRCTYDEGDRINRRDRGLIEVLAKVDESPVYTCIGKGGRYVILARGWPSGTLRNLLDGVEIITYACLNSGEVFLREAGDFEIRMAKE